MANNSEDLHKKLSDAVVKMEEDEAVALSSEVVSNGFDAYEAIDHGLASGMERAGVLFEEEEYFIPELLMCSDAMYAGLDVLRPHLPSVDSEERFKMVIGVVEGDTHDIGKNLVKIMLESAGFDIFDLGRDISPEVFVEKAVEYGADIICLSTLMTTTMKGMAKVVELLKERGIRDRHKVMVGGGPISKSFSDKIGADGYAPNAAEAVRLAKTLCEKVPVGEKYGA
ncbi:MAG: corrinoid protein [Synergistaceae bacterium]|jgi:corrinoid protein of di/trimethylamine methyltransferase|nr:corrinoid protein [Synergistaceae bacterium]